MKKLSYIYCTTNIVNGKTYVGKRVCDDPENDKYLGSGVILCGRNSWKNKGAFSKYGIENFKKEILIQGMYSTEELNSLEKFYIAEYKKIGKAEYNLSKGGDGFSAGNNYALNRKTYKLSENTKEKISKAHLGKKFSEKHKDNLKKNHRKTTSKEGCENMRKAWTEEKRKKQAALYQKSIICIETGKIFSGVKKAAKELNLPISSLSHHLHGYGKKDFDGLHFKFKEL
jgi:group I intron endonuclease